LSYETFYHLREQPFTNTPDPRFYFESAQHHEAALRIMHLLGTSKGLGVIIGEIGTGKTTLARKMLDQLDERRYESALLVIIHSAITPEWFLRKIALQLGVENMAEDKVTILTLLYQRLIKIHEEGKQAVVFIDEANMLESKEIMEEIRGLLNLEIPGSKLINFVLFGLPSLDDHLKLDEPLAQRVAMKFRLSSMKVETTKAYIKHRLLVAGAKNVLFDEAALELIHRYSRGIPRLINVICDNALLEGFLVKKPAIEQKLIHEVAMDLGLTPAAVAVNV
jgi:type II secretory pathway predicted ATPase ExeA